MERRIDGGLSTPAFYGWRRWCSGVWGWGIGKRTKGKEGGGPPGFDARERKSFGALPRAVHGDARGGGRRALGAAWQGEERTRREAKAAVRARARRVGVHSKQEVARGPSFGGGRRGSAPAVRGTERQAGGGR